MDILAETAAGGPHLVGSRCRDCGHASFPARPVCGRCGQETGDRVPVGRRGRLQASAVVYHAPAGFSAPYVIGLVALDEGPIVFAPITGCLPEERAVRPGQVVELVIGPARPGGVPVFQFRPVPPAAGVRAASAQQPGASPREEGAASE
jgi:uncharacterized OB-fold protein